MWRVLTCNLRAVPVADGPRWGPASPALSSVPFGPVSRPDARLPRSSFNWAPASAEPQNHGHSGCWCCRRSALSRQSVPGRFVEYLPLRASKPPISRCLVSVVPSGAADGEVAAWSHSRVLWRPGTEDGQVVPAAARAGAGSAGSVGGGRPAWKVGHPSALPCSLLMLYLFSFPCNGWIRDCINGFTIFWTLQD